MIVPTRPVPAWEGWKEIAAALQVSEDTAVRWSRRAFMPLVVFVDGAGRVWCPKSVVADFIKLHHLPAWAHRQLQLAGRLPEQLDREGRPKARRRRAPARGT